MAWQAPTRFITEEEYLAGELTSDIRHEYVDGQVFAMSGGTTNHNRIIANIARLLGNHLDNTPYEPLVSDMKVKAGTKYFYPDAMVVCHGDDGKANYLESPILIIEVLSKSTRRNDQTLKRLAYQSLPSLREYVLIEQDFVDVEICRRDNQWRPEHHFLGDQVCFDSIDLCLGVEALYARADNEDMRGLLAGDSGSANLPNS